MKKLIYVLSVLSIAFMVINSYASDASEIEVKMYNFDYNGDEGNTSIDDAVGFSLKLVSEVGLFAQAQIEMTNIRSWHHIRPMDLYGFGIGYQYRLNTHTQYIQPRISVMAAYYIPNVVDNNQHDHGVNIYPEDYTMDSGFGAEAGIDLDSHISKKFLISLGIACRWYHPDDHLFVKIDDHRNYIHNGYRDVGGYKLSLSFSYIF